MYPLSSELTTKIPAEIYDAIIDNCADDKDVLAACSLVCRSWLPTTRYHLFGTLTLRPRKANALLQLLISPWATIAPYIIHVAIGAGWIHDENIKMSAAIPDIVVALESVQSLHLEAWNWTDLGVQAKTALLSNFRALNKLEMTYVRFDSFELVIEFICTFPLLQHISFYGVTWNLNEPTSPPSPRGPICLPSLRTLSICAGFYSPILTWLLSHERLPMLETILLPDTVLRELPAVETFLERIGPSLNNLEVGIAFPCQNYGNDIPRLERSVDLSYNSNLRCIHIRHLILFQYIYTWVISLLSSVTSPHIEEVAFSISLTTECQLDAIDWTTLGRVFAGQMFRNLKKVVFEVEFCLEGGNTVARGEVGAWISRRLGGCSERGILEVVLK